MTVKLSISVPDDVAAYLQSQGNASAAVTEAVRRVLPKARRARQRAAAQAYGEYLRRRTERQVTDDQILIESSNDIALRDAQW
jgi:Arc/MetJ-type ribon-helix-helix transcriptional regulator